MAVQTLDPRQDLQQDSLLWDKLLRAAASEPEAAGELVTLEQRLRFFRCMGTRLVRAPNGSMVMRPDIDPTGHAAWRSQEEYATEREKWLLPKAVQLAALLKQL